MSGQPAISEMPRPLPATKKTEGETGRQAGTPAAPSKELLAGWPVGLLDFYSFLPDRTHFVTGE
jgi:hypothetical protein